MGPSSCYPWLSLRIFVLWLLLTPHPVQAQLAPDQVTPAIREWTEWTYDGPDRAAQRVAAAHRAQDKEVVALFGAVGLEFPPASLHFRVIKDEALLEVWAADAPAARLRHITSYRICAASGTPGPKRRQGDWQVPEGFYTLDLYNDHSSYYLSMRISYPNKSDRILGHRNPGSAIMIHGNCVSIGCLAMSDQRIQELWVMADAMRQRRQRVTVHIYPGRDMTSYIDGEGNLARKAFWQNIKTGYDWFAETGRVPRVRIDQAGRYHFSDRP